MTRLTSASLAHRTVVMLLSLLIVVLGVFTTGVLKQELIPSMELPRATVLALYPGANPEAVERDVARPLEGVVRSVDGVTRVTSTSNSGFAQLSAEWDFGTPADKVTADIRAAIDGLRVQLPQEVTTRVQAGSFDDLPVLVLAASSDADPTRFAADVRDVVIPRLKQVAGVRDVALAGEPKRQVAVTLDQAALATHGVDQASINQFFTANATGIPAGTVHTGADNLDVQVGRAFESTDDLKQLRLQGTDGPVELGSLASVEVVPVESTTLSRVNGKPSLTLQVTKDPDGNTVAVAQGVRAALPGLATALGHGTAFATVFDQSPFIEQSIHDLTVEGGLGLAMAILVILVFLRSIRLTVITAVSIPLSLLMALIGLWVGGHTLNILTLGALTVAIGRVVDDSIVVIENIKRHASLGRTGFAAIVAAVREVAGAVTSSTLTTVAVFLPIGLVGGQAGEMFRPFAVTVTVALLASLLVSLTVVPVLASWFLRGAVPAATPEQAAPAASHDDDGPPTLLQRAYLPALGWALGHRALTLVIALALFGGTMALTPRLKTDFIGDAGQVNLLISQDLPAGTPLEKTDEAARRVEAVVASEPAVQTYSTNIGTSTGRMGAGQADTNHASFTVALHAGSDGDAVADSIRSKLADGNGLGTLEVSVGGASNQVAVHVEGNDPEALRAANEAVLAAIAGIDGLTNVRSDLSVARPMLSVDVDAAKAADAGMTQSQVGLAVTRAVRGQKVATLRSGDDTLDVMLRSQAPVTSADALGDVVLPVTQKQTMDTRKAAADAVAARQEAFTEKQRADAARGFEEQLAGLRDSRRALQGQLAEQQRKLTGLQQVLAAPPPAAPAGPAGPAGPPPGASGNGAPAPDPLAQVKGQVAQLTAGIAQLQGQIAALDSQEEKLVETRTKTLATQATSQQLAEDAKAAQKATATALRLRDVATVNTVDAPATITRVDGARTATITASPSGADLGRTTSELKEALASVDMPAGTSWRVGGVSQQQQESFAQLGLAMVVAIGIVYLIMVGTFGSLVQPLILLVSVPFAATGAVGLLLLTDTPLGIASMIGLLMLIGIVVTNAIVLIDLINQLRRRGASVEDAVLHGARLRLRPIVMTALATVMALVPMGLGLTGGGVFISKPLAIVVIGGLASSTLLTLILVPVLYDLVEKTRAGWASYRARLRAESSA